MFLAIWKGCPWVPSDIACIKLYQVVSTYIKLPRKCLQTTGSGSSKTSWQTSSLVTEWSTTISVRKKLVRTWGCCGPKSMVVNGGKYGVILWSSYICNIDKDEDKEADGDDALAGGFRSQWVCVMIPPSLSPWAWILYSTFPDHVISQYVHQQNQFKPGIIHLVCTCFTKSHSIFDNLPHLTTLSPKVYQPFRAGEYYHNPSTGVSIWENPTHCTTQLSWNSWLTWQLVMRFLGWQRD